MWYKTHLCTWITSLQKQYNTWHKMLQLCQWSACCRLCAQRVMSCPHAALLLADQSDLWSEKATEVLSCVCNFFFFFMGSSSNITVPCPSWVLVGEHLIALSHSRASIPGFMSAVTCNQQTPVSACFVILVHTDPRRGITYIKMRIICFCQPEYMDWICAALHCTTFCAGKIH